MQEPGLQNDWETGYQLSEVLFRASIPFCKELVVGPVMLVSCQIQHDNGIENDQQKQSNSNSNSYSNEDDSHGLLTS